MTGSSSTIITMARGIDTVDPGASPGDFLSSAFTIDSSHAAQSPARGGEHALAREDAAVASAPADAPRSEEQNERNDKRACHDSESREGG
jgi:hypothetical protein